MPPNSWPSTPAIPIAKPYAAKAVARREPAYTVPRMASTCGVTIAPAAPWRTRAITRALASGANPHAADVRVNRMRPIANIRRRP